MAALLSSAVTINNSWLEPGLGGKLIKVRQVTMVLTGQGGTTNTIAAKLFDLTKIESCTPLVKSDNSLLVVAGPSYDGSLLLTKAAGTAASADAPSGTYRATVRGV